MATKTILKVKNIKVNVSSNGHEVPTSRLDVRKTYKLYIDGKFPRTESGRVVALKDASGKLIANVCRGSRKDLRDSIVSNRKAQEGWAKKSAYNKAQILYRIAETLEGRRAQFIDTLVQQGDSSVNAKKEVDAAIDLLVYYAGWSDKYIQVFSSVNPVESSHFNFSYHEPMGVVSVVAPLQQGLMGMVSLLAPMIIGGNVCTLLASEKYPLTAVDFGEVLNASDVPGGVVNILTGYRKEFLGHASSHMDINAILYSDLDTEQKKLVQINAALNVKRVLDFSKEDIQSPYRILAAQETKTTWHPIGS
ncbi:MAG: aldehyde dehydrogenase family protein [Bacteroidetes bacterium]|jgi:acyl-CoA reductase-like NAD-dependent aldehyde dehydrogenase|nr:aldehyde dehydrogenase family protein [Bacteroidota bacterium]